MPYAMQKNSQQGLSPGLDRLGELRIIHRPIIIEIKSL